MSSPARMTFEDCARSAAAAQERVAAAPARMRAARPRLRSFKGGDFSRLTLDWSVSNQPADDEIRWEMLRLRARARDMARNSPYVRQYLNLLAGNVIGPHGPKLQAQVRNNDGQPNRLFNERIEDAWEVWAEAPTVDGQGSLVDFQHQCLKAVARDGEVFVRLHRGFGDWGLGLEAIDADLIDEAVNRAPGQAMNEVRLGVEIDPYGRRLAYHAYNSPASTLIPAAGRKHIILPADEVLHLYDPDRLGQTRGITWLAPVMFPLHQLDGYDEAEVTAARIGASAMGFFTRKEGTGAAPMETDENGNINVEVNAGTFAFAPDGYALDTWAPQHPNQNYPEFVKCALRRIASGLGVSYNVLANDLEGVNYSSMRSGLLIERDTWRRLQQWWIRAFLRPVYAEWVGQALLGAALTLDTRSRSRFLDVKWTARGWPWVDPLKDTEAGVQGIQTGLVSRRELLDEEGRDLEDTFEQLRAERELAAEYGLDVSGPKQATAGGGTAAKEPAAESPAPAAPAMKNGKGRLYALAGR